MLQVLLEDRLSDRKHQVQEQGVSCTRQDRYSLLQAVGGIASCVGFASVKNKLSRAAFDDQKLSLRYLIRYLASLNHVDDALSMQHNYTV